MVRCSDFLIRRLLTITPRADAGHLSQGVPAARVRKLWDKTPKNSEFFEAYVVFEGLAPGIYSSW